MQHKAIQDNTMQHKTTQDNTRQHKATQDTRQHKATQGMTRQDKKRFGRSKASVTKKTKKNDNCACYIRFRAGCGRKGGKAACQFSKVALENDMRRKRERGAN